MTTELFTKCGMSGQFLLNGIGYYSYNTCPVFDYGIFKSGLLINGIKIVKTFFGYTLRITFTDKEEKQIFITSYFNEKTEELIPFQYSCYDNKIEKELFDIKM